MAIFVVNGVAMPDPTSIKPILSDVDSGTVRMANALLKRKRIYASKRKFSISYSYLSLTDASTLLNAISGESFQVTLPDPLTGTHLTKTYYAGDRNIEVLDYKASLPRWKNLSFNIVEF